ncbi:MAG: alkaline phosphatase family protein [Cyclobacteriaceae bacterium]|nr:alkaline phosphatase family protein [Cyclobacteriaceae bacterium]
MRSVIVCLFCLIALATGAQQTSSQEQPKLVVGIVVDQMRQEYLYRFAPKFGEGGFKRLMNQGFMLKNAHYNYAPTVTGPGHASVYTGTTPAIHGIIGNDFYDKETRKTVNCVEDARYKPVGNAEGNGDVSPWRMLSSTISDELKLSTQKRSKVIGISIKDRGAVLPAGHTPNGAYWYDGKTGKFITSTYYMAKLPEWVEKFNKQNLADKYLSQEWKTYYPIDQYTESGPDESPYEGKLRGKDKPSFPYNLSELRKTNGNFELLTYTPFSNDYIMDMVKASLAGESLGQDEWTDFLAISFSATDYLGHLLGPNAVEVEDMYIRLDKNIEDLLTTLDTKVGAQNYTVFLTADHAVADVPQYLIDNKIPAGYYSERNVRANLEAYLLNFFPGREVIENMSNEQIFLRSGAFGNDPRSSGIDLLIVTELITKYMMATRGVANVYSENTLRLANFGEAGLKGMVARGYNPKRSGDIIVVLEPGWFDATRIQGTTHGSPYSYDTHVPVIFFGKGIKQGSSVQYHPITDIAPTLSVLLKIKFPNGCTGQPIGELFE